MIDKNLLFMPNYEKEFKKGKLNLKIKMKEK